VSLYSGLYATNQSRQPFGLCYRTKLGNDVDGLEHGYKIHIVYNALASPTDHSNGTNTDSVEPNALSWDITTTPPVISLYKPTAHLVIDSRTTNSLLLIRLEEVLYGSDDGPPRLPTPEELVGYYTPIVELDLIVIQDGSGSYSVEGSAVTDLDDSVAGSFAIDHVNVVDNGDGTFSII
jgi:hypothetical protein